MTRAGWTRGEIEEERGDAMFDALTATYFKTDKNGQRIFYPWGAFGRGVPITDPKVEKALRRWLGLMFLVSFGAFLGISWTSQFVYALVLIPIIFVWQFILTWPYMHGRERAQDRLTFAETHQTAARRLSYWMMGGMLATCLVAASLGLLMLVTGASIPLGLGMLVIFLPITAFIAYLIVLKRKLPAKEVDISSFD